MMFADGSTTVVGVGVAVAVAVGVGVGVCAAAKVTMARSTYKKDIFFLSTGCVFLGRGEKNKHQQTPNKETAFYAQPQTKMRTKVKTIEEN